MQGFLYAEAMGMPFGGWLVVNKSSGEILEVPVPEWHDTDKHKYLEEAKRRVKVQTGIELFLMRHMVYFVDFNLTQMV